MVILGAYLTVLLEGTGGGAGYWTGARLVVWTPCAGCPSYCADDIYQEDEGNIGATKRSIEYSALYLKYPCCTDLLTPEPISPALKPSTAVRTNLQQLLVTARLEVHTAHICSPVATSLSDKLMPGVSRPCLDLGLPFIVLYEVRGTRKAGNILLPPIYP